MSFTIGPGPHTYAVMATKCTQASAIVSDVASAFGIMDNSTSTYGEALARRFFGVRKGWDHPAGSWRDSQPPVPEGHWTFWGGRLVTTRGGITVACSGCGTHWDLACATLVIAAHLSIGGDEVAVAASKALAMDLCHPPEVLE